MTATLQAGLEPGDPPQILWVSETGAPLARLDVWWCRGGCAPGGAEQLGWSGPPTGQSLTDEEFDEGLRLAELVLSRLPDGATQEQLDATAAAVARLQGKFPEAAEAALASLFHCLNEAAQREPVALLRYCEERVDALIEKGDARLAAVLEAVALAKPARAIARDANLFARVLLRPGADLGSRIVAAQRLLWVPPKQEDASALFVAVQQLIVDLQEDRRRLKVYPTLTLLAQAEHVEALCAMLRDAHRDIVWALAEGFDERSRAKVPEWPEHAQEQLAQVLLERFWVERARSPGRAVSPSVLAALTRALGTVVSRSNLERVAEALAQAFLDPKELERGMVPRTVFLLSDRLKEHGLLAVERAFGDRALERCRLWHLYARFEI